MTKLKIVSWNINSVRARADLVGRLLDEEQPDILCLQETKALDVVFPAAMGGLLSLDGREIRGLEPTAVAARVDGKAWPGFIVKSREMPLRLLSNPITAMR